MESTRTGSGRPITERRLQRMRTVLERRQPDLTIVLENIYDSHNVSAVLRSCDAAGVLSVHVVYTVEDYPDALQVNRINSTGAHKWLDIVHHASIEACYETLRSQGYSIYATHLADEATELYQLDLTEPVAFVFGNENRGVSAEAAALSDGWMEIPMMGMVQSLNISVACAVTLYEAVRQRMAADAYNTSMLSPDEVESRLRNWLVREGRAIE